MLRKQKPSSTNERKGKNVSPVINARFSLFYLAVFKEEVSNCRRVQQIITELQNRPTSIQTFTAVSTKMDTEHLTALTVEQFLLASMRHISCAAGWPERSNE